MDGGWWCDEGVGVRVDVGLEVVGFNGGGGDELCADDRVGAVERGLHCRILWAQSACSVNGVRGRL